MKEGEIEDKDGNKLPVFWHKQPQLPLPHEHKPEDTGITEKGVEGCCPVGPVGMKGEVGVPYNKASKYPPKKPSLKEMLNKYLWGEKPHHPALIPIDDSLEKDIVNAPVRGRIYKIRQINVVARYRGSHLVSSDEGSASWVVYEMQLRDMTLFINKEDLLLASEAEVATFVGD